MNKVSKGRYSKVYKVYVGKENPLVPCKCKCPTCQIEWIVNSNQLDPVRKNYVYCTKHKVNKFKNPEGADWDQETRTRQDVQIVNDELQEIHYNEQRHESFG